MSVLLKVIYRVNELPIKILVTFFTEIEKNNADLYGTTEDPKQPRRSWERKAGGITPPDLRPCYKVVVRQYRSGMKTHIDRQGRTVNWEMNPHRYSELIYRKEPKILQGKNNLFNKWYWGNLLPYTYTQKLKWIRDLDKKTWNRKTNT